MHSLDDGLPKGRTIAQDFPEKFRELVPSHSLIIDWKAPVVGYRFAILSRSQFCLGPGFIMRLFRVSIVSSQFSPSTDHQG